MPRWIKFLLAILLGLAASLLYGWTVSPVEYVNTSPELLRIDYQTDYVLMTAEVYASARDPETAARSLTILSPQPPAFTVSDALAYAQSAGYAPVDIACLQALMSAMQAYQSGGVP
jgi:hypothetical protein